MFDVILNILEYKYFVGVLFFLPIYIYIFLNKNYRMSLIYSGFIYTFILVTGFVMTKLVNIPENLLINPGYWHPKTFFDLNNLTNGFGLEDILFMILVGGIAGVIVPFIKKEKIVFSIKKINFYSVLFAAFSACVFLKLTHFNLIDALLFFNLSGFFYLVILNPKLLKISFLGGISFGVLYFVLFLFLLFCFPGFISENYNLLRVPSFFVLGVPLEEVLFGITFGMFWSALMYHK